MTKRLLQTIGILILAGAIPFSIGSLLHLSWLLWLGGGCIAAAFVLALVGFFDVLWFWVRAPKPPVSYVECDDRAEPGGPANRSRPVGPETNRTSGAAGSGG